MHYTLSKYTTLNIKEPTSKLPKCYDAPPNLPSYPQLSQNLFV